jgi:hypothetical protein
VVRRPAESLVAPRGPEDLEDTQLLAATRELRLPRRVAARAPVPHHRIRIADGQTIELTVPIVLGRRPVTPRVPNGPRPRLLAVPSPKGEVSASHLEVRESGRAVVLTDLRSTNGTVVHVPGSPVRVLIGGETAVVSPGTLVDVGDGNLIEVLRPVLDPPDSEAPQADAGAEA